MTNNLREFLSAQSRQKFATDSGNDKHSKMQRIVIDSDIEKGDSALVQQIKLHPKLLPYFVKNARVEVPIAGKIGQKVISRRIDRMIINHDDKMIVFIDYKTDVNKSIFRDKYVKQMNEYSELLKSIYPDYSIRGLILWLQDFTVESF